MSESVLLSNLMMLAAGIDSCVQQKNTLSALILLYAAIDAAGWLDSEQPNATRRSFMSWTQRYLLQATALDCTAIDLYAARCGLLHTFTPESQLASEGEARYICYAWGDARVEAMKAIIGRMGKAECYVAVHFGDLYEAWQQGLVAFTQDLDADPERKARVFLKATKFFTSMEKGTARQVLNTLAEE